MFTVPIVTDSTKMFTSIDSVLGISLNCSLNRNVVIYILNLRLFLLDCGLCCQFICLAFIKQYHFNIQSRFPEPRNDIYITNM